MPSAISLTLLQAVKVRQQLLNAHSQPYFSGTYYHSQPYLSGVHYHQQPYFSERYYRLKDAFWNRDSIQIHREIGLLQLYTEPPTLDEFKIALKALLEIRKRGTPVNLMIDLFSEMTAHYIMPDREIYETLLEAVCYRDSELNRQRMHLERTLGWFLTLDNAGPGHPECQYISQRLDELSGEETYPHILKCFNSLAFSRPDKTIGYQNYNRILHACSDHKDIASATRVFEHMERSYKKHVPASIYYHIITTYVNAKDIRGAEMVFNFFLRAAARGEVDEAIGYEGSLLHHRRSHLLIYVNMIRAFFNAAMPAKGIELFEKMFYSPAGSAYRVADVPPLCSLVYTTIIRGFMAMDDIASAMKWFNRLLLEELPAPKDSLELLTKPVRPCQRAWEALLAGLLKRRLDQFLRVYTSISLMLSNTDALDVEGLLRFNSDLGPHWQNVHVLPPAEFEGLEDYDFST